LVTVAGSLPYSRWYAPIGALRGANDAATVSATSLARRLVVRAVDQQKTELLGAIQRVAPDSEEGRSIRMRLRELDAERQRLAADQ